MGDRLRLRPVFVFLSVLFWSWLWGIAGAFVAVPLLLGLRAVSQRSRSAAPGLRLPRGRRALAAARRRLLAALHWPVRSRVRGRVATSDRHDACQNPPMDVSSRPMRIAYVTETYPPEVNGVSLTVERTVRHLRERGHAVDLIRPRQPGEAGPRRRRRGRTAAARSRCTPSCASAARSARWSAVPGTRPELVHLATPGPLAWEALARRAPWASRRPPNSAPTSTSTAATTASALSPTPVLGMLRRFHNLTERTFVPTRASARELAAAGFRHLAVVGRGVDTARFDPARRSAGCAPVAGGRRAGAAQRRPRRCGKEHRPRVARLRERAPRRPAARMVVVGDGPAPRLEVGHPGPLRRRAARRRARGLLRVGRHVRLPEPLRHLRQRHPGSLASGLPVVAYGIAAAAEHVATASAAGSSPPATRPVSSPPSRRSTAARHAPGAMRPRRSTPRAGRLGRGAGRFEAHLEDTIDAHETPTPANRRRLIATALDRARALVRALDAPRVGACLGRTWLNVVSRLGDGWMWYAVIAACRGSTTWPARAARSACSPSARSTCVIYLIVKRCIARPRPFRSCPGIRACGRSLDEYSFPSGHTLHSVAFA